MHHILLAKNSNPWNINFISICSIHKMLAQWKRQPINSEQSKTENPKKNKYRSQDKNLIIILYPPLFFTRLCVLFVYRNHPITYIKTKINYLPVNNISSIKNWLIFPQVLSKNIKEEGIGAERETKVRHRESCVCHLNNLVCCSRLCRWFSHFQTTARDMLLSMWLLSSHPV